MSTRSIDFRLLEALQALVSEGHVSRAAERLGTTQPKLSNALARLRKATGDPLLIRTPEGMQPTALARELASRAGEFLSCWNGAICGDASFTPETSGRAFRIQAADFVLSEVVEPALKEVRAMAPGICVSVSPPLFSAMKEGLETGELDLVLGTITEMPQDFFVSRVTSFEACCIVSAHHPRIKKRLDIADYLRESHVVHTFGRSHQPSFYEQHIDDLISASGGRRRATMHVPYVLLTPTIVAESELIATVPKSFAERAAKHLALKIFKPPLALESFSVAMLWHARTKNDPAAQWFRDVIRRVAHANAIGS